MTRLAHIVSSILRMGLGKTVICLSLVVANPPPKHNQVLPREHLETIDHPSYSKPPCVVGCTSSSAKNKFLSNGSLVIAPMTLCSQWQSEIERFAPWMSILTLHSGETPKVEDIASKDIVVVSTFVLQNPRSNELLNKLKRVHFHRTFLDESHYNQSGQKTKLSLAALSATYRYCVTGTPIGHSLDDLHGQVRTILAMKSGPFSAFGICTSFSQNVSPILASLPPYSSIL
jgi:SNF2 family DNA or RNA helicase